MNPTAPLRRWLQKAPASTRFAFVAALAATLAYLLGSLIPVVAAVPAAITALVAVRPTFHDGLREGLVQIVGTVLGGFVAAGLVVTFGPSLWVIGTVLVIALVGIVLVRLPVETAIAVGVPIILVLGTHATVDLVWARLWGVTVGAVVAVLASLYASPGTPTGRALLGAQETGTALGEHLQHVGRELSRHGADGSPVTSTVIHGWLARAEELQQSLHHLRADTEAAVDAAAWSPLTDTSEARRALRQVLTVDIAASTSINMLRDLLLASTSRTLPAGLLTPLGDLVGVSGSLIREHSTGAGDSVSGDLLQRLADAQSRTLEQVRSLDDTAPLALGGALIQDATKIRALFAPSDD